MDALKKCLVAHERELHSPGVRRDRQRVEQLLHPAFHEIGRSGVTYSRVETISNLLAEENFLPVQSQAFNLIPLGENVCLLTYQSAVLGSSGGYERHTYRSSIWFLERQVWQLVFHQGTPAVQPFEFEELGKS